MTARRTAITCASAACLAICVPAVKKSEGYWPTVKVDTVGTGRPCTGGYGETQGVKCGETHSEKYWSDRLQMRLADQYDREIGACITRELPDSVRAAAITTAYNAGSSAVCKSPMVAKWNAGEFRGGCEALLTKDASGNYNGWYIRAQGRVLRGLIKRRGDDKKMCLAYLTEKPKAAKFDPRCNQGGARYEAMAKGVNCSGSEVALDTAPVAKVAPKKHWYSWIFKS